MDSGSNFISASHKINFRFGAYLEESKQQNFI